MADSRPGGVVPSLIDRLMDFDPGVSKEPPSARFQNIRELTRSVARDLEWMLNTRREIFANDDSDSAELTKSLLFYGLPDFTSLSLVNIEDCTRIRKALEQAISDSDPRLKRVTVELEPAGANDHSLHFRVDAMLRIDPSPEPVTFDAVLQLGTQQYQVKEAE